MATAKNSAASRAKAAAATKAVEAGQGKLYEVLSTLHHDGKSYVEGDQIALDEVTAEPLIEVGTIKPAEAAK